MRQRFRWSDSQNRLVPIEEWTDEPANSGPMIMGDIQPYRSMIDGSIINSRSQHRRHLREHGCIEVGNDSSIKNPSRKPIQSPPGLTDTIRQAVEQQMRKR